MGDRIFGYSSMGDRIFGYPVWVIGFIMGDSLGVFLLSMLYCVTAIIYSLLSRKDRLSPIPIL